jgi:formiminotetrahydrofolate cyclodeaminase
VPAWLLRAVVGPDVALDLVVVVLVLTPDAGARLLRTPYMSLDLFLFLTPDTQAGLLFLRVAALVLHLLLQLERVETSPTRRPIEKNLPSMPENTPPAPDSLMAQLSGASSEAGGHPAGGVAAALVAGLAAALAAAAADASREAWDESAGVRAQALTLARRAAILAEQTRMQYAQARQALEGRAPETEPSDDIRDWALGLAIRGAAVPLMELAETAADIAELAAVVALHGAGDVRADAVVAADLASVAARSAAALVQVNLIVGGDSEAAAQAASYADAAARAAESVAGSAT